MKQGTKNLSVRWLYLAVGVVALLFAGIIYAWSILKTPLSEEFGWTASSLAVNFTLTMCFFCLGATAGGLLLRRIGLRWASVIAAVFSCGGFVLSGRLSGSIAVLYLSYGVLSGFGIGIAYNLIISTVSAWFPDRKGLCSGALLMGFGASALILGSLAGSMIANPAIGWRTAYTAIGAALGAVILLAGFLLRRPGPEVELPAPPKKAGADDAPAAQDFTPGEMLRRASFWKAFLCIVFLAAVGNTVISFARDLAISVGTGAAAATTLVGILSVCNGLGRILTGALFDKLGRRKTMLLANAVAIVAAGITLLAVATSSVPLCIAGLCITGLSYGTCPTITTAFTAEFYGSKNFSSNFPIMNFNLMGASFIATAASLLLTSTNGYTAPFLLLLALSAVAMVLNLSIRKP